MRRDVSASMTIDGGRFSLHGGQFSACLEEGSEDSIRVVEVVMYDIDEERSFHKLRNELLRGRVMFIEFGPLRSKFKGLILDVKI